MSAPCFADAPAEVFEVAALAGVHAADAAEASPFETRDYVTGFELASTVMRCAKLMTLCLLPVLAACTPPKIDSSCTMNGLGRGECSFTNTGGRSGAVCGKVDLSNASREKGDQDLYSAAFCSGDVGTKSTTSVSFLIPGVEDFCQRPGFAGEKWSKNCDFAFRPDK
jgi:hypothetical protein